MADDKKKKKPAVEETVIEEVEELNEEIAQDELEEKVGDEGANQDPRDAEIEQLKLQVEEYKSQYLRAIADYSNLERRVSAEQDNQRERIKADIINKLLPFLDNLEKAELFIKDPGLQMIKDQFIQTLKQLGVEEVELEGKEYDPHTAEAIEVVEGDKDNVVVKVSRKAYKLKDRVIQHGLVSVSKKSN